MKKRAPKPAPAPQPVKPPAPPAPLSADVRGNLQRLLTTIERTLPALRTAGAFDVLGLVAQAGHALKMLGDHTTALERAAGLIPPLREPAPAPAPTTHGVKPS